MAIPCGRRIKIIYMLVQKAIWSLGLDVQFRRLFCKGQLGILNFDGNRNMSYWPIIIFNKK